jgi:rfaE bifunctional protein kinase chain/domain
VTEFAAALALGARNPMIPDRQRLLALVDRFAGRPVLMLLDAVADRFLHGVPKRISREAPVLILRSAGESVALGGGANAAANVSSLGGEPLPVGCVGDDATGAALLAAFESLGIATSGMVVRSGWPTPTKTRILAGFPTGIKQQVVRFDQEEPRPLAPAELAAVRGGLERFAGRASVAVLSDYGYGTVVPELLGAVRGALAPGGELLVDSRFRLAEFRGIGGATPNEEEAEALWGGPLDAPPGLDRAGAELRRRLEARFLLVTRGSQGLALFEERGAVHVPVHGSDQVADVTGAGDTVIGTFALALAAGASPLEAALLANYAGGVVVMKAGTATLGRDELAEAIRSDAGPLERATWAEP